MIARRASRRGLTTVAVLALLVVVGAVAVSIVRLGATYHVRSRAREQTLQSETLADAGLDRAFARIAADPDYSGERWEIPAEAFGRKSEADGEPAAVVTIVVETEGETRVVRVQADHPVEPERRVRSSRRVALPGKS